jgi:organic radical activating enzyme
MNKLEKTKKKLDSVSPSLCLAKWQQVTVHLQNGHTHSCHHPQTHKVPLEELEKNPSALHNTTYKKFQRKLMLEGTRPDECDYCWKVEDTKGDHYSDRIKKSSNSTWAMPYFDQVVNADWNANVTPAQVEVSFGNVCNMKCVYCSPVFSSEWWSEIKHQGAYPTSDRYNNLEWIEQSNRTPYLNREHNPYVEAWWKWWPEIKSQLRTLRITGGEPLLNKNTFKLLDELDTEPQPAMNLEINTNLSVNTATVSKTLDQIADLKLTKSINNAVIHTSCDCAGEQAEYIREGMQYDQWLSHCKMVLKRGISLHIMVTANMLSIDTMIDLMTAVYRLKQEYKGVTYGVSILHSPKFLNVLNLPKTQYWQDKFTELFDFVKAQQTTDINEFNYIDRLCKYFAQNSLEQQEQIKLTQDAKTFIKEIDRRRNKNFTNTFPNYNFLTT